MKIVAFSCPQCDKEVFISHVVLRKNVALMISACTKCDQVLNFPVDKVLIELMQGTQMPARLVN